RRLLPLAERARGRAGGPDVLPAGGGDQGGHEAVSRLPAADGLPAADRRRVGVGLSRRRAVAPALRPRPPTAARLRLGRRNLRLPGVAGRAAEAQWLRAL